jgi:hypothetical protein
MAFLEKTSPGLPNNIIFIILNTLRARKPKVINRITELTELTELTESGKITNL